LFSYHGNLAGLNQWSLGAKFAAWGGLSLPNPIVLAADLIAHHYTFIDKLLLGSFQTTAKISRVGNAHPDFFQGGRLPTLPPVPAPLPRPRNLLLLRDYPHSPETVVAHTSNMAQWWKLVLRHSPPTNVAPAKQHVANDSSPLHSMVNAPLVECADSLRHHGPVCRAAESVRPVAARAARRRCRRRRTAVMTPPTST